MRRRDFIAALGGAAASPIAWALAADAQQRTLPVVGVVNGGVADAGAERMRTFRKGVIGDTGAVSPVQHWKTIHGFDAIRELRQTMIWYFE